VKLASMLFDHLSVRVEQHHRSQLKGRPIILAQASGSRRVVLDASPQARGVVPGMPLSAALSHCKDAVLLEADLARYRQVFDGVLDALEQRGVDVEEASLGEAYIRLDNAEAMYGGEPKLLAALLHAVPTYLTPRMGVGPTKFIAFVAAHSGALGDVSRAPDNRAAFLAPLSIDVLPVPWALTKRLHGFGLHTLGQVSAIGVGPLQAQLGLLGRTVWELAEGIDIRPLLPRKHEGSVTESMTFFSPLSSFEAIVMATNSLLAKAFRHQEMRGRFARICSLEGSVFRAPAWEKHMAFREPMGGHKQALKLIKHTLEGHPPPGPLEDLQLTLTGLTGEAGRQESLFREVRQQENLREMLEQLEARLGQPPPIYSIREVEPWSRLPERRRALVPYTP
jgi:nucleotidyltransferase/DNA polymerase involved in DNA repair